MEKLKNKEYDFSAKLRQTSMLDRLKDYITWRRSLTAKQPDQPMPACGPVSINLDLTSACNFVCPHCVDEEIINTGEYIPLDDILRTIDCLHSHGLLSIILLGGGEPTLHKDFETIVRHIKSKGLQLGIVTNGTKLDRILCVADLLSKHDWVRLSIDAATQETFNKAHCPRTNVDLATILHKARELKRVNRQLQLGYSFVIVWEGLSLNGCDLYPNVAEMSQVVMLAKEYDFDYVSFKPCLIRLQDTHKESLLDSVDRKNEQRIITDIQSNLQEAYQFANGYPRILESVNLRAMLDDSVNDLKTQPQVCHMQFFNTVVAPSGIFHCPAFRGVAKARIAEHNGYTAADSLYETQQRVERSLAGFNAQEECRVVGCFYHHVNWWLENFICSEKSVDEIEAVEDDNFFL